MQKYLKEYELAKKVVKKLQDSDYIAYFAGGAVRDVIAKFDGNNDIDIATEARPDEIKTLFDNVHGVGASFGVMLVVENGVPFEVATFREDGEYSNGRHPDKIHFSTAQKDAQRRDFTINGMFLDPITDEVYDYVGGKEDLKNKIIRTIGSPDERFSEDYLRMLRAIRFAVRFDFTIESKTWDSIKKHCRNINKISAERIFTELNKMLTGKNPSKAIRMLLDTGLLKEILPEVVDMVGVEQPAEFHKHDVFDHTMEVLDNIGDNPTDVLAWSALLHDVGKPATQTFEDRIRFNNHHKKSAEITKEIFKRLRASNSLTEQVVACVENHMHFIEVQNMRVAKLKKFLSRPNIEDELNLHKADCAASHGSDENYVFLKEKLKEFEKEGTKPTPFLHGKDLIDLGLKPGRYFREILNKAYDMQLENELISRENAINWLKDNLDDIKKNYENTRKNFKNKH